MEKAKRARKAETPKQPSLRLRLRAPYLYPDHRRLGPADQDEKQSLGDGGPGEIVFCDVVLALARRTVDNRNVIRFGIAANAPTKTASQSHHMSVVQRGVRSSEQLSCCRREIAD